MIEFLSIGAHAVRRSDVQPGQRALVVGTGPIGMAVAIFSSLRGAKVTVLDTREDRLAFCKQHLQIDSAVLIGEDDKQQLDKLTHGEFFDVVYDATGNAKAMERGFEFIAHGGKYVLVSIVRDTISFSDPEFHKREATLMGSRNATVEDFRYVEQCLRDGLIPDAALNTHRMALSEVTERFTSLLDPAQRVVKAIVEC
jgi:2-desacetyl-2-hydroxyethyl bacteriochlorophyllide A dehydrogenase